MNIRKSILLLATFVLPTTLFAQRLEIENTEIDCGDVEYRQPATATFKMKNRGSRKLVINDVRVGCGCLAADYPKNEIESGEEFTIRLTYDARQMGHFFKEASIYSNASKTPVYISMIGVVKEEVVDFTGKYPYEIGDLRVDKRDLEFDDVNRGDSPVEVINIANQGSGILQPNLMHLPPYLSADISPQILRPGKMGKIWVTLNSADLHDYGITQTSIYLANKLGETVSPDNEIIASAVLLPSFTSLTETQLLNAPKVTLSEENLSIDFGNKEKKTVRVDISNTGKSPLKITSLHMFSSALKITLGKTEIPPGEKTTLKITVNKTEAERSRTKPRVMMITNDPDKPKVVIGITKK